MRVLLLNQAFYPDIAATAQQASDLAVALAARGHEVTVIAGRRAYDNGAEEYPSREEWQGVHIRRISALAFGKSSRWRRALSFGSYLLNCVFHLASLPRFDVVVAMTSPPLVSWLGAMFTTLCGGRFVFWVMDLNPDEALAAGWLQPGSWTTRRLAAMLNFGLHSATRVVVLDRFMAQRIEAKQIPRDKIVTLPPWSRDHLVSYDAAGRERFRKEHGLDGKYVVMYSGNHSPCHSLRTLLEAARALRNRQHITFCFVGGGSEFRSVREFAATHSLANIKTIPYQPVSGLSASLSSADLHVVVMGNPFVGLVHPCKVYNIRTLGIPYLYIGPVESHVSDLEPTFSSRHGDVQSVVSSIERASHEPMWRVDYRNNTFHSQSNGVRRMSALLEEAGLAASPTPRAVAAHSDTR